MDGKIRNLTTRNAWVASSLLLTAACSQGGKAVGEEEPSPANEVARVAGQDTARRRRHAVR
jgi:hypothetical protein